MKHRAVIPLIAVLALAIPATAEEHKHKEGGKHREEAEIDVKIPETAAALWKEIDAQFKTLGDIVAAKTGETHAAAETVEALVAAVPAKHPDLDAAKRKRVEGQAKNAARVLHELHDEADEGHWEAAAKKLKQVEVAIKIIRSQVES